MTLNYCLANANGNDFIVNLLPTLSSNFRLNDVFSRALIEMTRFSHLKHQTSIVFLLSKTYADNLVRQIMALSDSLAHQSHLSKTITLYLKLPFAKPRLMALNDWKKANPSRPCVKAKAHNAGDWIRLQEISLVTGLELHTQFILGSLRYFNSPCFSDFFTNIKRLRENLETNPFRKVDIVRLST
jgi:hypothetical protein